MKFISTIRKTPDCSFIAVVESILSILAPEWARAAWRTPSPKSCEKGPRRPVGHDAQNGVNFLITRRLDCRLFAIEATRKKLYDCHVG